MPKPGKVNDPNILKKQKSKAPETGASSTAVDYGGAQAGGKLKEKNGQNLSLHPLEVMLGSSVRHSSGTSVSTKTLAVEDGVIALYFAAHWCPPCRMMSPQLALLYDEMRQNEKEFEVVFISFDYSEESYSQYLSKMPWYAIDYKETDKREELAEYFAIRGIPVIILLEAETCEVITLNGREILSRDPLGKMFPWKLGLQQATTDTLTLQEVPTSPGQLEDKTRTLTPNGKVSDTDKPVAEDIPATVD